MKNIIRVSSNGQPINNLRPKDHALHEEYAIPKIPPEDFDLYEYIFQSNPGTGTTEMFTIPFDRGYIPMAQIMINQDGQDTWTPLTRFYRYLCQDQQFVPPFDFKLMEMYITAEIDDDRIRVFLTKQESGAYSGSSCAFPNINGEKFNFKYYIFREGLTDDDIQEISATV